MPRLLLKARSTANFSLAWFHQLTHNNKGADRRVSTGAKCQTI